VPNAPRSRLGCSLTVVSICPKPSLCCGASERIMCSSLRWMACLTAIAVRFPCRVRCSPSERPVGSLEPDKPPPLKRRHERGQVGTLDPNDPADLTLPNIWIRPDKGEDRRIAGPKVEHPQVRSQHGQ
jgi:hypothetical protein